VQRQGNFYIFTFAAIVCIIVSIIVALSATALKPRQVRETRLDIVRNILSVSGLSEDEIQSMNPDEVLSSFQKNFSPLILDKNNNQTERTELETPLLGLGYTQEELSKMYAFELVTVFSKKIPLLAKRAGQSVNDFDPGYKLVFLNMKDNDVFQYILPIDGYGLWGMMYGYVAIDRDLVTVKGIRFYKHQETPGLGGECEKPWFTDQYIGKKILNQNGDFVSVNIVKGKAGDFYSGQDLDHYIDGISGATITGDAINAFLKDDITKFEPYFQSIRTGTGGEK